MAFVVMQTGVLENKANQSEKSLIHVAVCRLVLIHLQFD